METKKNITNKSSLSKSNDKRSQLLLKVDNLMEKLDNEYGPFLLDELNKRLEKTIEDFNSDLKIILNQMFDAYDLRTEERKSIHSDSDNLTKPTFIAEYEEKIKSKKK